MDISIFEELIRTEKEAKRGILVTVVDVEGSSPAYLGKRMLVLSDGSTMGTVGGGTLEYKSIDIAKNSISQRFPFLREFELEDGSGMICGGKVKLLFEPIGTKVKLFIFGGGHIGKAVASFASSAGFRVVVIDERQKLANKESIPSADIIVNKSQVDFARELASDPDAYVVVATRSHSMDKKILKALADKSFSYIGMLASKNKKKAIFEQLREEGISEKFLGSVHSPIGLDINSRTIPEIAISIVAELIKVRNSEK